MWYHLNPSLHLPVSTTPVVQMHMYDTYRWNGEIWWLFTFEGVWWRRGHLCLHILSHTRSGGVYGWVHTRECDCVDVSCFVCAGNRQYVQHRRLIDYGTRNQLKPCTCAFVFKGAWWMHSNTRTYCDLLWLVRHKLRRSLSIWNYSITRWEI